MVTTTNDALKMVGQYHLVASARDGNEEIPVPARDLLTIINCFWDAQKSQSVQDAKIDRAVETLLSAQVHGSRASVN